ncbi:MAG: hypothetical protein WKH64_02400 [Chloroflexia bacterium]
MTTQASAIDYTARLASVQARLDEQNLDALLVFGSANRVTFRASPLLTPLSASTRVRCS